MKMTNTQKWILGIVGVSVLGGLVWLFSSEEQSNLELTNGNAFNGIDKNSDYGKRLQAFESDKNKKQRIVDELLRAMKGVGTNFTAIKNALKDIEDERFMKIFMSYFHKHTYHHPFKENEKLDLRGWFKEELSEKEYQQIKDMYPNLF